MERVRGARAAAGPVGDLDEVDRERLRDRSHRLAEVARRADERAAGEVAEPHDRPSFGPAVRPGGRAARALALRPAAFRVGRRLGFACGREDPARSPVERAVGQEADLALCEHGRCKRDVLEQVARRELVPGDQLQLVQPATAADRPQERAVEGQDVARVAVGQPLVDRLDPQVVDRPGDVDLVGQRETQVSQPRHSQIARDESARRSCAGRSVWSSRSNREGGSSISSATGQPAVHLPHW